VRVDWTPFRVVGDRGSTNTLCGIRGPADGVERSHVDLEHMLLSESDEELLGLLRQEQAAETGGLLQDPLRRRVFAIRAGRVATDGVVEATDLPPKYSGGVSAKVESGRSVFRHTFGERSQRFGFAGATRHDVSHFRAQPAAAAAGAAAGETVATLTASLETTAQVASPYHFDSTLGAASSEREIHEAEEEDVDMEADESPAPVAVVTANSYCSPAGVDISIKQEVVIKDEPAAFKHEVLDVTPVTPVRPQPIAHPSAPVSLASSDTPAASSPAMFHTPLRRSMSSPSPSVFSSPPSTSLSEKTSFVSLDRMASIDGLGFAHGHSSSENNLLNASQFRSMSPADELEKVAALHDKGTLGKLDKVEWRASPASAQSNSHGSGSEEDQSEQLKIMRSSEGSADRPSIAVVVSGSPATSLPPRYIKGECSVLLAGPSVSLGTGTHAVNHF